MRPTLNIEIRLRKREGSANPNPIWKMGIPRFLHVDDGLAFWFADKVVDALHPDIVLAAYNSYDD